MGRASRSSSRGWQRAMRPAQEAPVVCAADLERAWRVTHREGAPVLAGPERMLMLSGLFSGQSTWWLAALDTRLKALEDLAARCGCAPDAAAFEAAAQGRLPGHAPGPAAGATA